MGYIKKSDNAGWGMPSGIIALILWVVMFGAVNGPATAYAAVISCGQCHNNPPGNYEGCKPMLKNHSSHSTGADLTTCDRCHPTVPGPKGIASKTHNNNITNITSVAAPGMRYNTTTATCTNACHKNKNSTWGTATNDCNICHFRNGALGNVAMSGLHVDATRSWKHFSSIVRVNGAQIGCNTCHKSADTDITTYKSHIQTPGFIQKGDMSQAHTYVAVTTIGYTKGATPVLGTCAKSCHYNGNDPFGNYTIYFKPGQKKRFGTYQTAAWGDTDLKCNECHSTPSQEATFGNITSFLSKNANLRHSNHMFRYKLNPWNFQSQDRNIYCDDCHRTPDINATRGFQHHSTIGGSGNGVISLPVQSQNSKVNLQWRSSTGRDGISPAVFNQADNNSCSNVYCHTFMVRGEWTEEACNACHGKKDGVNVGSGAPGYANFTTNYSTFEDYAGGGGAHYTHVTKRGYACRACHYDGGGDGNPANHHNVSPRTVSRANVNVGVEPKYWFNNKTSIYSLTTRSCSDVSCHYGASQNWDCAPLH